MGTPHKNAEILRAIADGKDVQWSKNGGHTWGDYRNDGSGYDPLTNLDILWRIKPEPKPDVVMYVGMNFPKGADNAYIAREEYFVNHWPSVLKVILDGETGKPKAAEVLK